mgnify:CR=1 FL=1
MRSIETEGDGAAARYKAKPQNRVPSLSCSLTPVWQGFRLAGRGRPHAQEGSGSGHDTLFSIRNSRQAARGRRR